MLLALIPFALITLAVLTLTLLALRPRINKITECGYIPEDPHPLVRKLVTGFWRVLVWWQARKVTVKDWENLRTPGPKIIAPNHGHYLDPVVWPTVLDEQAHYLIDRDVLRSFGGLAAFLLSPTGAIPVNIERGKGTAARHAGVKSLSSGKTLVVFPEGWAYLDGSVGQFKKGTVRIAKETARNTGVETYIVPAYMRYGTYPGQWLKKFSNPVQFLIIFALAPFYRAGLQITIGKPIAVSELPLDDEEASEFVRQKVIATDPARASN